MIVISGMGQLSAIGQGMAPLQDALTGDTNTKLISKTINDLSISFYLAPEVELPAAIPDSVIRRMSRISKMFFATALEAIDDAWDGDRTPLQDHPARIGIVIGTAFSCYESAIRFENRVNVDGPTGASPSLFASSIQNAIASHLSISLGIRGPTSTVTTMEHTTIGAFRIAYDWLKQDVVDHVIVAIGDELSTFNSYAMAFTGSPVPSQLEPASDKCTAIAGEGTMSFVLSKAEMARKRYCEVAEVELFAETCPSADRYYAASFGARGQWSRYTQWTPQTPLHHAKLYGSMITGAAFEIAIAALATHADHKTSACVQITDRNERQVLLLKE